MIVQLLDDSTWPLDVENVYGETRRQAIARVEKAVHDANTTLTQCEADEPGACNGREDLGDASRDLATITLGARDEFSLDGIDQWTWTILADSAEEAAGRAEWASCHE